MALRKRGTSAGTGTKLLAVCLAVVTALSMVVAPVGLAAGSADGGDVDHSAASSLETSAESTGTVSTAAVQPSNFSSSTFLSGVNQPMGMTFLPDGRMLLLEKPGTIEITDPDDGTKDTSTYLDITGKVNDGSERGLIDIALDPNFEQNGYVYVFYSNDAEDINRIARFTHQENGGGLQSTADASSEFVVWKEDEQWQSCCHQGAGLDFGPEGKLWLTTGDDFEGGAVSQDLSRASGKVIRVNKDGTIPQDNPYVDDGDPNTLGEIWAYGVRNPFRAEWDLQSGRFFFGDVGGNSAPDYEEVNVATLDNPAANYGWPDCEGTSKSNEDAPCDVSQTAPVYSYPHSEGNSITGGEVYRGQQFPDEYQGAYFFGDYAKDWIKYLTFDSNGDAQSVQMFEDSANNVNAISVGPDGSLYWTSISDGTIHEVTYTGNQAPSIDSVSATPTSAASAPQTVDFSVSASDPEGDSLTYAWTFGDGSTGSGASPSHTYQSAGTYTAYVEVSDGTQTVESQPVEITIGEPPSVTIDSPADGSLFQAGDTIAFSASGSDPQDGTLSSDAFTWDVVFDHDPPEGAAHTHPVLSDYTGESGSFDVPTSGHGYSTDTSYTLTVTATDSDGLSASDSVTIEPDKADITFATDPGGLELSVDGLPVNDGTVIDTLVGFEHEVSAPTTQCLNGREYEFQGWSDGGAQTHTYTVPTSDATLTANYQDVGECSTPVTDGLVAQYEADQGLSTSGGQVTGWADQSGQGNDLTAAGDPTTATAPSGQPAVSFDGSGDKLERTAALNGFPSGNGDRSVILVTKYESTGYGGFAFGDDATNQAFGTVVDPGGDLMVQGWGGSNDFSSGAAGTGDGWLIQSATHDGGSVTHYKNGTQIDQFTHTYGTDLQQLVLGAEIDSDPYLDMEVAAVYVYDRALSDSERQQVESHLQEKYFSEGTTNQNPTAVDDSASVTAGSSTTIDVLANDDDPDGSLDASTVTIDQGPAHGTATVNADGSITYAHDGSDTTSDTFVYQVSDDQGAGDAATVTVSIDQGADTGGSSLPVTSGLVTHFDADQGVSVGTGDVVTGWADQSGQGNDLTATGDPLVKHDTLAGNQVISLDGDGDALVRTAALNGLPSGNDDRTIMYVVDYQSSPDWGGGVAYGAVACNNAFGLIVHDSSLQVQGWCEDFTAPASAEVGSGDWLTHSAVLSGDQVTHYKNGTQVDQFTHTYDTDPQKIVVGAELDEDPYVDMEVAEVVVYDRALTDTERQQVETYFEQTYFTANAAPTASDDSGSVTAGQSTTIDVLANDDDSDGSLDASSVQVTSGPATGTATANPDGTITYSAPTGASGDATFTYTVADDDGATSNEATVTVSISEDTGTDTYGTSTGQATNVVIDTSTATNASATLDGTLTLGDKQEATPYVKIWPEGQPQDAFWYTGATTTQSGGFQFDVVLSPSTTYVWQTVAQSGDGAWKAGEEKTFTTPTGQYFGVDSTGASDVGVESATLNGEIVNLGDNADAQVYFTYWKQGQKDSTLTWYTGPVQDSAGAFSTEVGLDPGTTYEYRAFGQSNEGEWKAGPATTFTTQTGQTYNVETVDATNVDADSATLNGELTGLGDNDNATVYFQYWKQGQKGSTLNWWTGSSLSSPGQFGADVAGLDSETTYVFQAYAESDSGTWTAGSEETFTTTAFDGTEPFGVDTDPATGVTDTAATLNAEVTGFGDADSVQKAHFQYWKQGQESSTKQWTSNQQLSEPGPYSADVTELDPETTYVARAHVQNSDGIWTSGGTVEFTTDATGTVNQPPTASDDSGSVTAGSSTTIDVLANDADSDGNLNASSVSITSQPATGTATANPDGTITYSAPSGASGDATFTYTVADDDGATSNEATVTVSISDSNQPPTASDDSATVDAGQSTTIDVLANDTDSDGSLNASSVQVTSGPSSGTVSVDGATGAITYTHDGSDSASDSFTYSVADDDGATDTATVTVTVTQPTDSSLPVSSGLVTHLEADQGVTTNGGTVTNWTDQSSAGIDLSSAGDPTLVTDGPNGNPVISLDGGSDGDGDKLVRTSDLSGLPSGAQDRTMFVVTKYDSTDAYVGAAFGNGDNNQAFGTVVATGGDLTVQGWGDQNDLVSDTPGVGAGWLVQSATVDSDQVTHYKDGTQIDSGTQTYDTTLDATSSKFVVGEEINEIGYADMEIAAVVVYDRALTDSERQQVEDYFQQKYFGTADTNQPPTASDDSASVTAGQSTTIDVLANDADSDGSLDASSVSIASGPATGTATVNPDGTITYDAPSGASGDATFTYTVDDDDGATSNEATVTVSISAANTAPTASDDSGSVTAGQSTTIDVLANDTDSDGSLNASSVQVTSQPASGTATVNPDGTITYSAPSGASGDVTFSYSVADDDGATDTATVTVTVTQPPDSSLPVTSGLVTHLEADQGLSTSGGQVTGWTDQSSQGNDLTAAGDPTTATAPSGQPAVSFDGSGDKLERTAALNGFPSGNDDRSVVLVTKYENTGFGGFAFGDDATNQAFGTIVDSSGDLMVQGWGGPNDFSSGAAGTGDGWLIQSATVSSDQVTHYKNGAQIDQFTHTYDTDLQQLVLGAELDSDPYLDMEVAAVVVYDRALSDSERQQVETHLQEKYLDTTGTTNQPPTASDDSGSVTAGQSTTIDVLANDDDPDGSLDASSVQVTSQPATGTATVNPDGTITYSAPSGASGDATFTYTVADDDGATSNEATVTVSISAANTAPTASDDSATVNAGQSVVVDVLANDTDSDGSLNASSVQVTSGPSSGSTSVDGATGAITYTHDGSDSTSDSFTYSVADDDGATDTATVSVTVTQPASSLPVTSGMVTHFDAGQGVTTSGGQVTGWADQSGQGNDLTATGDPTLVTDGPNGEPVVSLDGTDDLLQRTDTLAGLPSGNDDRTVMYVVNYQSSPNFGGGVAYGAAACNNAFGLIVHDSDLWVQGWCEDFGSGASAEVGSGDWLTQSAVLASDQVTHYKNGTQIDQYSHVYDTDPQKIVIGAELDGSPLVDMEVAEVVIYDRALTETERQQVESHLQEKYFDTTGTTNQPPTASDDSGSVTAGQSTTIDVLANDADSDGTLDASSVQVTSQPATGTATANPDGTITYSAPSGASGDATFGYTVDDDEGATSNEATVTVSISAANTAPTASDDSATVDAGQSTTIDVLANDTDSDGSLDASSVQVTSGPSSGTVSVDGATGAITYTHDGSASTSDSFTYTVADDDGATSNEATVSVTVTQPTSSLPVTSGLVTHLEADQGVTTSGGQVTGWADQSGQGNDLAAVGDPTTATAPSGQPAISLDGDGDKLERTDALSGLPSGSQNRTMFVVTEYSGANAWGGAAFGDGAINEAFGLVVNGGAGQLTVQGWGSGNDLVSDTQGTGAGWLVQSATVDSDQVTHYKDGTQIDSGTHTYATDLQKFVVGEEIAGAGYVDMEVAAVLVYDRALTETERQQVEQYLEDKYGIGA